MISLYACSQLIISVYIKWDEGFTDQSTPIWKIPFPAVTICPETKTKMSMINFTTISHELLKMENRNVSIDELKRFKAAAQVCNKRWNRYHPAMKYGANFSDNSIFDILTEIAPTLHDTLHVCYWGNKLFPCRRRFTENLIDEGLCFTFNTLRISDIYTEEYINSTKELFEMDRSFDTWKWNIEKGYENMHMASNYPLRVFKAGAKDGLSLLLHIQEKNLDYLCHGPASGFKVLLHTPGEIPQLSKHFFRVSLLNEVTVLVKPNMMTTSESLRKYDSGKRQCYFDQERHLRFFKIYTQRNCDLECLSNFTYNHCGCVKFSMPRDNNTPICGVSKMYHYDNAEKFLSYQEYCQRNNFKDKLVDYYVDCNCLPACTTITYDTELTQASFDTKNLKKTYNGLDTNNHKGMLSAHLSIFFKEDHFITSKRSEVYGLTDFLASCGGALGLFMGVSLLSFIEIIYFFTLRFCCKLNKKEIH